MIGKGKGGKGGAADECCPFFTSPGMDNVSPISAPLFVGQGGGARFGFRGAARAIPPTSFAFAHRNASIVTNYSPTLIITILHFYSLLHFTFNCCYCKRQWKWSEQLCICVRARAQPVLCVELA